MATSYTGNVTPLAHTGASASASPAVYRIGISDLHDALRLGWEDFKAVPSPAIVLCVIYPILGLVLALAVLGYSVLPLLFPLAAGFALIGPFAALGLYELSRRRERGEESSPRRWSRPAHRFAHGAVRKMSPASPWLEDKLIAPCRQANVSASSCRSGGRPGASGTRSRACPLPSAGRRSRTRESADRRSATCRCAPRAAAASAACRPG